MNLPNLVFPKIPDASETLKAWGTAGAYGYSVDLGGKKSRSDGSKRHFFA